jgi:transposase
MPSILLRDDDDAASLRAQARRSRDVRQTRRLLALAAVYDGMSRAEAARVGGMDRQTLRDWAHRFNGEGPDGLKNRAGAGRRRRLSDAQMQELATIVETGPDRAVDKVVRWRRIDLKRVIEERFGVVYSELAFSHISGLRTLAAHVGHLPPATPIEVWFQDEARLGQKNGRTRVWARTGSRPRLPTDQRYANAYLFGAICPARGTGAALMLPLANTDAMQLHLQAIADTIAPDAHALVLMDRAGWHKAERLEVPDNLTIILLPSRSPELNPAENVWQYLRQNSLSNRVFESYDDILDAGCEAWNNLIAQPETITSIGMRDWAHIGQ